MRSSHAYFVKASGVRWVCLMLLAPIPGIPHVWGLPFLTVLSPSERYHQLDGRHPQTLLDRARQTVWLVRRWLPERELVVVGDHTDATLEWLDTAQQAVYVITRLRLDAALYEPAPHRTLLVLSYLEREIPCSRPHQLKGIGKITDIFPATAGCHSPGPRP